MTAGIAASAAAATRVATLLFSAGFVLSVFAATHIRSDLPVAIYALSFWHYFLYWLAYRHGAASPGVFRRDAIAMKTVSLAALFFVYLASPPDVLSLAVVAGGFLLNAVAANALGVDRTYYGHEVAGLPAERIVAFPYSWISHPMLAGNIAAFAGTMINADFRLRWWPLASIHVAMNLGLLFMELWVTPRRGESNPPPPERTGSERHDGTGLRVIGFGAVGAAIGWATSLWGPWGRDALLLSGVGACMLMYAFVMFRWYSSPGPAPGEQVDIHKGDNR